MEISSEPLAVLWEDPHGLVVNKPAEMLTQKKNTNSGEISLEDQVRRYLRADDPSSIYLGTVHRLDRPVSGVILWAKSPRAARRWAGQFARREVRKEYWAIVEGDPATIASSGQWDDWLKHPDASGRAQVVEAETPGSSRALTKYEIGPCRCVPDGLIWLKLRPESGRTHQLRAQASARGTPIVGDLIYGSTREFPIGIALHARSLTVEHPIQHRPITWDAPLPVGWSGWLEI